MEPVLLKWGPKPRGSEKHAPLLFVNPLTREQVKIGVPLSSADFEGSEIGGFYGRNNILVNEAVKWGVKLDETGYNRFLEVGLRHAQQLDGPLRERTYEQYKPLANTLEASLITGILSERKRRRDAGLDAILECCDGMTPENMKKVSEYVAILKTQSIPTKETEHRLELRLIGLEAQQRNDDKLVKNYQQVAPELRAAYLAVVEISALNKGFPFQLHDETEDIRERIEELGVVNGKLYLTALNQGLIHLAVPYVQAAEHLKKAQDARQQLYQQRSNHDSWRMVNEAIRAAEQKVKSLPHPRGFSNELDTQLKEYDADNSPGLFLSTLCASQEKGLWLGPDDAGDITDTLCKNCGLDDAKAVITEAFSVLDNGPAAFFKVLKNQGVQTDYLEPAYVKPTLPE